METHRDLVKDLLASGLTQQALGKLVGRSQAWVGAVLTGKYSDIKWSEGQALRRLHAERCQPAPARALACATQSVRLTADRRDTERRELARRVEPVDAPQPGQLPLALVGETHQTPT